LRFWIATWQWLKYPHHLGSDCIFKHFDNCLFCVGEGKKA